MVEALDDAADAVLVVGERTGKIEYVQCVQAMFKSFTDGKVTPFEGKHYRFTLLPPFFSPGRLINLSGNID